MKKLGVLLFVLFGVYAFLYAQQISMPYECGFEDTVEINNWKLNSGTNGSKCNDQWMVGNLDMNGGFNSLYISCDTGKTTTYGSKPNSVIAYRKFEIPMDSVGSSYIADCSFDYKCVGELGVSVLKFYLLPDGYISESDLSSSATTATLSGRLRNVAPHATLHSEQLWRYWSSLSNGTTFTLEGGKKYYMIFVWENRNSNKDKEPTIAACVDNIQLSVANCWKPENMKVDAKCDTIKVSWEGMNENYEFEYKPSEARMWRGKTITKEHSMIISDLPEGLYDVRVRGLCGNTKSAWVVYNGAICYCPDRHCINFVTLDAPEVMCEFGQAVDLTAGAFFLGASGPMEGRHTVKWMQNELDPNTGNKLRTIPEGALASVRLGDNTRGGYAEGIQYEYTVDTTEAKIILMKYAVVLEKPGHGPKQDPGFVLEIVDEVGKKIDPSCGVFSFTPEKGDFWNKHGGFVWKDWTAIGLNLEAYHGRKIYIHLVTQDCTQKAHTGYAYFTLDCIDAAISNNSCGETVTIEMEAPDGFEYIWTNEKDRDVVISTAQKIDVPANDITTYYCEVIYKGLPGCGFELHTQVTPRFAYAQFDWEWKPENCENKVVFTNKSCVSTRVEGVETLTDEPCEAFEWKVSDGEETSFENWTHTFPREGGTFDVTLISYISGGACYDDTTVTITVPPIYEYNDTIYQQLCQGETYKFDNQVLALPGVYTEYKKTFCDCDSITVLDLSFITKTDDVHVYDTVCSNDVYIFNGVTVPNSGTHRYRLKSEMGCDSIVFLHLTQALPIGADIETETSFVCADDEALEISINYVDTLRLPAKYSLTFDAAALGAGFENIEDIDVDTTNRLISIPLPENCRPNSYTATVTFKDGIAVCDDISLDVNFDVYYSASILQAKFDNLITILSKDENGGYDFVDGEYQWYKNDQLLEGENSSFYYMPDGEYFRGGDCFYMIPKRVDDGVTIRTCEICPEGGTPVDNVNKDEVLLNTTLLDGGQSIVIDNLDRAMVNVYSCMGQLISSYVVDTGRIEFDSPQISGFYFIQIVTHDSNNVYKVYVR